MRILLAEDDAMSRDMLSRRLKKKGYTVIAVEDGEKAVAASKEHQPDIILMDLDIPVMDGWEATAMIKDDASTSAIPIIAVTSYAMASDRDRALGAGCDDYESKPFDLLHLLSKIEALAGRSG